MAKEYLVVLFVRPRRVKINGLFMGHTNRKLELEGGLYQVTLGPPANFSPESVEVDLRGTSSLKPLTVEFREVTE